MQFYINHNLNASDRDDIYFLPKCVIQAHASPFLLKKNSPFLKPINDIISAAIESGLTQYWYSYSTPKIFSSSVNVFALKLHQLESPIDLLLIGYCLAAFVFVMELCYSQREFLVSVLRVEKSRYLRRYVR